MKFSCLKKTSFLRDTEQVPQKYLSFMPGLIITLLTKGLKWTYFDLVTGTAWRLGLIAGAFRK